MRDLPRRSGRRFLCISLSFLAFVNDVHSFAPINVKGDYYSFLFARLYREYDDHQREVAQKVDRPTQTDIATPTPDTLPSKPKIVVLGASGKIGRLVVQQLLDSTAIGEATVVAVVRNYDKACRVLYENDSVMVKRRRKRPVLQIVQADLVPPEELPGFRDDEEEEDKEWLQRASSAAKFYGKSVSEYDDGTHQLDANEALQEAIQGCTTIISCVGTVRPTNLWSDFLARPMWRILRKDVRDWCSDPRHPFYVNYSSTRKALRLAEKEQARRDSIVALEEEKSDGGEDAGRKVSPRIRFIRISDLCVAQQPWQIVPLLTNIIHSLVFLYQEMAEKLLQSSSLIDTIVLRPGDLSDESRNTTTTSLQVCPSGKVPSPSRVGREDVASLAVAAALWTDSQTTTPSEAIALPFHYTLGVRWAGTGLAPYPSQGSKSHGSPNAPSGLQAAIKRIRKEEKRERRHQQRREANIKGGFLFPTKPNRRAVSTLKPHGICAAIPVYLVLYWLLRTACQTVAPYSPAWTIPLVAKLKQSAAFVSGSLASLLSLLLRQSLRRLSGRAATNYISF